MVLQFTKEIKRGSDKRRTTIMDTPFFTNRKLSDEQIKRIVSEGSDAEPVLFAICGEISNEATYNPCALLLTKSSLISFDLVKNTPIKRYAFADIKDIFNKRMYGNGVMRIITKNDEKIEVFRFTFTVTALCDAAVIFVKDINNGVALEEAKGAVEAVYEKMLSICPKCGRTLSAPGVPCVHCMSKRRLITKLSKYLKPEWLILTISVIISINQIAYLCSIL